MRNAFRGDQQIARAHRQLAVLQQEQPFAFDDGIDLVHAGMRVQRVRLPGLEGVEADEQASRLEDRALAHLVGRVHSVLRGLNHDRVRHGRRPSRLSRQ